MHFPVKPDVIILCFILHYANLRPIMVFNELQKYDECFYSQTADSGGFSVT